MGDVKRERIVTITDSGVQFGGAWFSHESITGYSADQLNSGDCKITGRQYMGWLNGGNEDTAQSELAALREELAKQIARTNDYCSKLAGVDQRLTAAEQRNSELSVLLSRAKDFAAFVHKCVRKNGEYAPLHWQEMVEIDRDLSAALNSTESGASD